MVQVIFSFQPPLLNNSDNACPPIISNIQCCFCSLPDLQLSVGVESLIHHEHCEPPIGSRNERLAIFYEKGGSDRVAMTASSRSGFFFGPSSTVAVYAIHATLLHHVRHAFMYL